MGVAEYLAISIFSCLGLGILISVLIVAFQVSKHRKKTNSEKVRRIRAAEQEEADRLQKKEDEALAQAMQE